MKTFIALMCLAVAFASAENGHSKITKAFKRAVSDEERGEMKSTILEGLCVDEFIKPKVIDEDDVAWMLQPVTMDDCMELLDVLNQTAQDMMDIADGFFYEFNNATFDDMSDLEEVLMSIYMNYIEPKELDLEGLKDYVNGLLMRAAVLAGTDFEGLEEKNELGCVNPDRSEALKAKELGCVFTKGKLLQQAIEVRQMITFTELYDDGSDPLEFCDSVYGLFEMENITAGDVAGALVELMHCTMRNGFRIESRMNPDEPGYDGEPKVPMLPVPRLIHLQSKMEVYELQGFNCYMSFMSLQYLMGDNDYDEDMDLEARSLIEEATTKVAKRHSKY